VSTGVGGATAYLSKVCTNPRTTKIDGSLHRLCELHRRKANQSQQRLHQRHREERAARRAEAAIADRPTKRVCPAPRFHLDDFTIDPVPYVATAALATDARGAAAEHFQRGFFAEELASPSLIRVDMTKVEMPMQPLPIRPSVKRLTGSAASVDDTSFIVV